MISVYIHIPFCLKKCSYCDFVSFANCENEIDNYICALEKEIKLSAKANKITGRQVCSIFFGGGTPSILSVKQLEKTLKTIKKYFNVIENCETTLEANPATSIDFVGLQAIGFNRISIGVQSFNDKELSFLERLHNSKTAEKTILEAKKYFDNVNIDLIYGVPKQKLKSFECTINKAISLDINHISAYNLIYEEGTKLDAIVLKNEVSPLSNNLESKMYEMLCSKLAENNFNQYEVSNFAQKNYECKHNQNYWNRKNYIGFGVASHSCLADVRFCNTSNLQFYFSNLEQNKLPIISKEILTEKNIYEEKIFLGLRSSGIEKKLLNETQTEFMKKCVSSDLSAENANSFILTSKGKFIMDSIALGLLS